MIIETKYAEVISNIPSENEIDMTMSDNAEDIIHLMSLLTNLYKDPELAVIREYYSNAIDAQAVIGETRPVEVTLPSWDAPVYTVRDFGVGMSEDDLRKVFSKYGVSTKRKSNVQIGAFGLGCKSALTITQQFTVVSVKDGQKTTAIIAKTEQGINKLKILPNGPTTDHSGTTVKVPISTGVLSFNRKADHFFSFSAPGKVLVGGRPPANAYESFSKLAHPDDPDMVAYMSKSRGTSYVVMGDVPYELSQTEVSNSIDRIGLDAPYQFLNAAKYFPVPIGSVDLSPSREGIQFTDKTKDLLDSYIKLLLEDIQKTAYAEIDQCTTLEEIDKKRYEWDSIVNVKKMYKGKPYPTEIRATDHPIHLVTKNSWGSTSHQDTTWIGLGRNARPTTIVRHDAKNHQKLSRYLTPYMNAKGVSSREFIISLSDDIKDNEWVKMSTSFEFIDSDKLIEIAKAQTKKERAANGPKEKKDAVKLKYPVLDVDTEMVNWVDYDKIDPKTPYLSMSDFYADAELFFKNVYQQMGRDFYPRASGIVGHVKVFTDEKKIILLGGSRTSEALSKRVKSTRNLLPEFIQKYQTFSSLVTDGVVRVVALKDSSWRDIAMSATSKGFTIDDPLLSEMAFPPQTDLDALTQYTAAQDASRFFSARGQLITRPSDIDASGDEMTEELNKKYPLTKAISWWNLTIDGLRHFVDYLNMVHGQSSELVDAA